MQRPVSTVNTTLPTFAAERRAVIPVAAGRLAAATVSQYLLNAWHSAANPPHAVNSALHPSGVA